MLGDASIQRRLLTGTRGCCAFTAIPDLYRFTSRTVGQERTGIGPSRVWTGDS
jgi:hypothetical protein